MKVRQQMFARLGMFPAIAGAAVAVVIVGWAVLTETSLLGNGEPVPVVEAQDEAVAVKVDETPAEAEPVADSASTPTADEATEDTAAEDTVDAVEETAPAEEAVEQEVTIAAPAFDLVRVESDGTTVVAGTGPAGWDISVLVDGEEMATVPADETGQFVAFLDLGTSDVARVMALRASDGQTVRLSEAQVIIAPVETQIAEVEDEAPAEETEEAAPSETADVAEADDAATEETAAEGTTNVAEAEATEGTTEAAEAEATEEAPVAETADITGEEDTTELAEADTAEATETTDSTTSPTVSTSDTTGVQDAQATTEAEDTTTELADSGETTATPEDATEEATKTETAATESEATEAEDVAVAEDTEAPSDEATTEEATQPSAPAVLLVGNDGVEVMQSASPQVLDELSIAAITYADDGSVFVTGFSPAGFLRVYVNNQQVVILEVPESGEWKAELVDVAPGVYTLRVDQVDENGDVQQRVETPFQREEPAKVVAAVEAQTRRPLTSQSVVQPGSTLWAISREAYGSGILYVRIFEANKGQIRNPHLIYPGQIFELPAPPGAQKQKRSSGQ